ncbi:hypothetical protein [Nocardia jiangxiensis]|uniref:hypothetical protein n=1 Tax=Nocardia jiangxiensis TaxID=282685 RepID=UPI0002F4BC9E|nr:hypothetical protein [Nocardia jiangxiensis]
MTDNYTPAPYEFGLAKISGITGKLIWLGQLLAGRPSKWEHAFLIVDAPDGSNTLAVLEAEPGGARLTPLSEYWDAKKGWTCAFAYPPTTADQQAAIDRLVPKLVGVPYSWLDYISLALLHLHIRPQWVVDRVAGSKGMICSQLVDYVYMQAGVHFFDDGRYEGDVMPSDLDYLARQNGWFANE